VDLAAPDLFGKEHAMSQITRPAIVRSLAVAALLGVSVIAAPAMAQTTTQKPATAETAASSKPETVEQRITSLKAALKIAPAQETKWNAVAQAMRENASAMEKLVSAKHAQASSMTAVDDLKIYEDFAQARVDGLKNLTPAFKGLYDSMSADQKKNADQVFQHFGAPKSPSQG
jgi:hypothetical protein